MTLYVRVRVLFDFALATYYVDRPSPPEKKFRLPKLLFGITLIFINDKLYDITLISQ